jgi:hypothetical protein
MKLEDLQSDHPNERAIGGFMPQETRDREDHATGVGMLAEEVTRGLKGRH